MKILANIGAAVIVVPTVVATVVLAAVLNGYTLSVLWGWFVVPTFHLPTLPIAMAMGIALTVRYITNQDVDCVEPERPPLRRLARTFGFPFLRVALTLGIGWVIHRFV